MIKMKMSGDWAQSVRQLSRLRSSFGKAIDKSVAQEAHYARKAIIQGVRKQAPADGKKFERVTKLTRVFRRVKGFRGRKALIRSGALLKGISVKRSSAGRYFVGVLRGSRGRDGTALTTIARMNEEGATFVIKVTPRMMRFLMANLRNTGKRRKKKGAAASTFRQGYIVVRIRPRPFVGPVIEAMRRDMNSARSRVMKRLEKELSYTFE